MTTLADTLAATIFVGLGNPDFCYRNTRHNIGFMLLDRLAERQNLTWRKLYKGAASYAEQQGDEGFYLLKPLSYMNCSGVPLGKFLRKKGKFETKSEVLVIHDDLDLALGRVKLKYGGSDGGHRGLRSIDASIGRDYWRLRIGIGRPAPNVAVEDYVLQRFSAEDKVIIDGLVERAVANIDLLRASGDIKQPNSARFLREVMPSATSRSSRDSTRLAA